MSILINLLPDLRQAKLRERRRRQMVSGISVAIWIVCAVVVVLLSAYAAGQKVIINNDTNTIASQEQQLKQVPGLLDAYTAEQHLASLPGLYNQRVYLSKFFKAYMASDPTVDSLSSVTIDSQNNLLANGTAPTYAAVAKLARALTASNVTVGPGAAVSNPPYFTDVTIKSVEGSGTGGKGGIDFNISATLSSEVVSGGQ